MTASTTAGGRSGRTVLLVVVLGLLLVGVVALRGSGLPEPYGLDDAGVQGYKGLRLTLERLGTRFDRIDASRLDSAAVGRTPIALVPVASGASRSMVRQWRDYVAAGGTLVVGTPLPGSKVRPGDLGTLGVDLVAQTTGNCNIAALRDLGSIYLDFADPLQVPIGASSCYGDGLEAYVISQRVGSGTMVTLASPNLFTNDAMRRRNQEVDIPQGPMRDNVVVAQRLLDPTGDTHLAVVTSGVATVDTSGNTRSLTDLIRPGVKVGLWELLAAFVFFAWWRARRHGRVVVEHQPVPIAGSELTAAVGNLMSRRADPGRAASVVRRDTARVFSERLGVPRDTDPRLMATMIAARTGRDEAAVAAALFATPVQTDADLIAVMRQLESIRQEMLHGRQPPAAATPTTTSV